MMEACFGCCCEAHGSRGFPPPTRTAHPLFEPGCYSTTDGAVEAPPPTRCIEHSHPPRNVLSLTNQYQRGVRQSLAWHARQKGVGAR